MGIGFGLGLHRSTQTQDKREDAFFSCARNTLCADEISEGGRGEILCLYVTERREREGRERERESYGERGEIGCGSVETEWLGCC